MTIFFLKSVLSLLALLFAVYGMYTMFEVFGRGAAAEQAERLKKRHKVAGYGFVLLFVLVSYLCVSFLAASKAEPSSRTALHILLSLLIIALLLTKVFFVRNYRQFYGHAKIIGITLGVLTFALVGISAGFYLTVSRFGQDRTVDKSVYYSLRGPLLAVRQIAGPGAAAIRTDQSSIARGRTLFASRCAACHDPASTRTIVGPGLKGLLRNPLLPVSGHPATPESIRFQLRQPMGRMPSFAYLSDDEMNDLIAYLNTL
jgi:hypothetical protein